MKELELVLTVEKEPKLIVYCLPCDQVLYEAEYINPTTLLVASMSADGHSEAFDDWHEVLIINLEKDQDGK